MVQVELDPLKVGPWASSIGIFWEPVRAQVPLQMYRIRISILFSTFPGDRHAHLSSRSIVLEYIKRRVSNVF